MQNKRYGKRPQQPGETEKSIQPPRPGKAEPSRFRQRPRQAFKQYPGRVQTPGGQRPQYSPKPRVSPAQQPAAPQPVSPGQTGEPQRPQQAPRPQQPLRPRQGFKPQYPDRTHTPGRRPQYPPRPEASPRPAQTPQFSMPALSTSARRVALDVLEEVLRQDAYASLSLDERLNETHLPQVDRRLCASLVYRTLENLGRIDYALDSLMRDAGTLEPRTRNILRQGACQILFFDRIPESAAVDEAVKLTRALGLEALTGVVNGTLRNLAREKDSIKWPGPEEGARYLSVMFSLPEWMAQKLIDDYGLMEARQIASFRTEKHFITIRPNPLMIDERQLDELLSKKVWETKPGIMPGARRVYGAADIAHDTDFVLGKFTIQGEGSMLAAEAVGVKRGMQVLDCCAAPGGKTAYLAGMMQNTGRIFAWDLHEHRVELLQRTVRRLQAENVRAAVRDATVLREEMIGTMDAVLLDAPCTGIGVMDDKPDVKYRQTPESLVSLCGVQENLLNICSRYVKAGGVFVYSTCSMLRDENDRQISRFLSAHKDFILDPLPESIPEGLRGKCGEAGLQLLPYRDHTEGFFIARMRRVKA